MKKTRLIVFTGIDGSGKTTQAEILVDNLKKDGINAQYIWCRWKPFLLKLFIHSWKKRKTSDLNEDSQKYNTFNDRKKKLLSKPLFMWLWLIYFFMDYGIQIFIKIRFNIFRGKLVISDRVFYDSVIDQSLNLGKKKEWLLNNLDSAWMALFFPKPDMVMYVDCPEEVAFARKEDAPNVEYLMERRKLYLDLADKYKWHIIDGTLPVYEIAVQIKKVVNEELVK